MRQGTIIVTPPSGHPVTLEQAKAQLRVDAGDTTDDAFINRLIAAAHRAVENMLGYPVLRQTRGTHLTGFASPCAAVWLGGGDSPAIDEVRYYDASGVLQVLDPTQYQIDDISRLATLWPAPGVTWPATQAGRVGAVQIDWSAGWASAAAVEADLIEAMLLLISHWDQNREAVVTGVASNDVQFGVDMLLEPHRLVFVA